jgi:hypothetical protein
MKSIKTVFKVKGETYAVEGFGQDAASVIIEKFPVTRIILLGFMVNDNFVPANYEE